MIEPVLALVPPHVLSPMRIAYIFYVTIGAIVLSGFTGGFAGTLVAGFVGWDLMMSAIVGTIVGIVVGVPVELYYMLFRQQRFRRQRQ